MAIPFLDLFNKLRDRFSSARTPAAPPAPPARAVAPRADRFNKTVMPRPLPPRPAVNANAPKPFAPTPRQRELPPALAKALEPKLERAISLRLSDFVDQIPAEYVKPVEVMDVDRSVTLKASELEKGMPELNPTISLSSLYQQIPEIFLRSVSPADATRVPLPYAKVLEQFNNVQVRPDQQRDERVPQLETPILQATIEDTQRFGTKMEPVESSPLPPVAIKPATAANIASAEPEPAVTEIVGSTKPAPSHPAIRLNPDESQPQKAPFDFGFKAAPPPPPLKIPFQFPPNGTGAPASERVPASSGPPVPPISLPPLKLTPTGPAVDNKKEAPEPKLPQTIPFKLADKPPEPAKIAEQKCPPTQEAASTSAESEEAVDGDGEEGPTITLALKPIFKNMPVFQREGDVAGIADDVKVKFPLDLVQPQLATGRVLVPARTFQRLLPTTCRPLFILDPEETSVSLPLQEVLKNLPAGVLNLRDDQQKFFPEPDIVTPISLKAKEDAERFKPKVVQAASAPAPSGPTETDEAREAEPETKAEKKEIDGKQVLAAACKLPGVAACELMFPDGLSLAGNLPAEKRIDGLSAMAPTLLQRIDTHMLETKLGALAAMTLHTRDSAITFFINDNIYLAALHQDAAALSAETRTKLRELLDQLSQAFAKPEMPNVDH